MSSNLNIAVEAVQSAAKLLQSKAHDERIVESATDHDIKLQLDLECQELLTRHLSTSAPGTSVLGEEGVHGDQNSEYRWIVDPIDGTVNFFYGIPHYCITVALQRRIAEDKYETIVGVTLDPSRNELFTAEKGKGAFLNGRPIKTSRRAKVGEAVLAIGFSKTNETVRQGMTYFERYNLRAKKLRVMGAAALDLAYVAAGRLDAYYELVRIWDIAAGLLLVTEAGGRVETHPIPDSPHLFATLAFNGALPFRLEQGNLIEFARGTTATS